MPSASTSDDLIFNPEPIAFGDYTDGIRLSASYTKSLASTMRNAAPADLGGSALEVLRRIESIAIEIDDIVTERQSASAVRPFLDDFVAAFGGMNDALLGKSRLPASLSSVGQRAAKLHARVFADGVAFLRKDAHAAWSEGDRILRVIQQQDLERELDEVVGPELHSAAKKATHALREALGIGKTTRETPSSTRLQQTLARFSREVTRYARILSADVDVTDLASVERFRKAVMIPIDTFRSRRGSSPEIEEPGEPEQPADPSEPSSPAVDPAQPDEPIPAV